MPCPNCKSNNLWDDNLAWGCNDCSFFTTGGIRNVYSPDDRFNGEALPKVSKQPIPDWQCPDCKYHNYYCICETESDDHYY